MEEGENAVIKTKRWNDPTEPDDGLRVLICRYRPRGVPRKEETWHLAWYHLGPSKKLHADFYGKQGPPITWEEYRQRYLDEMREQEESLAILAQHVAEGKTLTLLCSSACEDATHCHRSLLRQLIEERVPPCVKIV